MGYLGAFLDCHQTQNSFTTLCSSWMGNLCSVYREIVVIMFDYFLSMTSINLTSLFGMCCKCETWNFNCLEFDATICNIMISSAAHSCNIITEQVFIYIIRWLSRNVYENIIKDTCQNCTNIAYGDSGMLSYYRYSWKAAKWFDRGYIRVFFQIIDNCCNSSSGAKSCRTAHDKIISCMQQRLRFVVVIVIKHWPA